MVSSLNEGIGMPKRMNFDVKANDKIKKSQDNADRISSFKKAAEH
jgi:hypothetical protein